MDKIYLKNLVSDLKKRIRDYQNQIELNIIELTPFIVQVGALTITTDADGVIKTQNVCYPTQFTQKAVNEILTMSFHDGFGEKLEPIIYSRINWYSEKIKEINETLNLIGASISLKHD